jgi:hypothetical protein
MRRVARVVVRREEMRAASLDLADRRSCCAVSASRVRRVIEVGRSRALMRVVARHAARASDRARRVSKSCAKNRASFRAIDFDG